MGRHSDRLLSRLTPLGCPICFEGLDSLLADGVRAGALVLAVVAAAVIGAFARFAWRIARVERVAPR
jgi:hypothetical protein